MLTLQISETLHQGDRRRGPRYHIDRDTTLVATAEGRSFSCTLEDISLDGARLHFPNDAPDKGEVVLEHPDAGVFLGDCVWLASAFMGVRFRRSKRSLEHALQCISVMISPDETRAAMPTTH